MHLTSLLAVLSIVPLALSTAISTDGWELDKRQRPVRPCSHLTGGVHVIAAGGDGVQNTGKYGLIGSLATSILRAIPGSTNVTLPYDKSRDGAQVPKIDQGVCPDLQHSSLINTTACTTLTCHAHDIKKQS